MDITVEIKHAGEALKIILGARGIKQGELAKRIQCCDSYLSRMILNKSDISNTIAAKLDSALSMESGSWSELQKKCDAGHVRMRIRISFD